MRAAQCLMDGPVLLQSVSYFSSPISSTSSAFYGCCNLCMYFVLYYYNLVWILHTRTEKEPQIGTRQRHVNFSPLLLPLPYHDGAFSSSVDLIFLRQKATRGEEVRMRAWHNAPVDMSFIYYIFYEPGKKKELKNCFVVKRGRN